MKPGLGPRVVLVGGADSYIALWDWSFAELPPLEVRGGFLMSMCSFFPLSKNAYANSDNLQVLFGAVSCGV